MTARRWAVVILLFIAVLYAAAFGVACTDRPTSTDAGADPDISDCCLWFVVPLYFDRPGDCLCKHTDPGMQRWLTCLDGLEEYTCDKRGQE
jgi:hypothetical protein